MAGITSLLNIAKTALLTQQMNLQTTGHNVSNVNTEGYSKQEVTLQSQFPNLSTVGPIGNGVEVKDIVRAYDRFITSTLFSKQSDLSGLKTRESGMKTIEGLLNEVDESGLYNQLNEFWAAWDDVANNAEGIPERITLIERAKLLVSGIKDRYKNLLKLSEDVNLNIEQTIKDINQAADQIAALNVQIVAMEANGHEANDLRDQRDLLMKRLSGLADLHYFETTRGTYTVILGKGFQLVDGDKAWHLEYTNGSVNWIGTDGSRTALTTSEVTGGELGGWIDIKSRIAPRESGKLTGSIANTSGGSAVNGWTRWDQIDGVSITGAFDIHFSGTDQDGLPVQGTFHYDPSQPGGERIQDFLDAIESAFSGAGKGVTAYMNDDGRLVIEDLTPGQKPISFQVDSITGLVSGLDLGKFDGRYPPNYLETLNQWATALIKEVNMAHSQGAGLVPLTETTGVQSATNTSEPIGYRSSGLYFSDQVNQGRFELWLYDNNGNVIDQDPSTPEVNDPVKIDVDPATTTVQDIQSQLDAIPGISARLVNGHLVIGVDNTTDVAGFAFGKDTSGALLALGLNAFFQGVDAESIGISTQIQEDPRLLAAAKVEQMGTALTQSQVSVTDPRRPLGIQIQGGGFDVVKYGPGGSVLETTHINVDPAHDSIQSLMDKINAIDGMYAELTQKGLRIYADSNKFTNFTLGNDTSNILEYLGMDTSSQPTTSTTGLYALEGVNVPLDSLNLPITSGSFNLYLYDEEGSPLATSPISITVSPDVDGLEEIAQKLDAVDGITAGVVNGRLDIRTEDGVGAFLMADDTSGIIQSLGIFTPSGGGLYPANNENALSIRDISRYPIESLDGATLNEAYQNLIGQIGIETRGIENDHAFLKSAVSELEARRDEVSGVSIDEELSDLLKFQHAYTAAAKLIKTADELYLSLLQAKQ